MSQPQEPFAPRARPVVMGVLNVTPDSFSDGGLWDDPDSAIAHGFQLVADGADIVDVGGESTRPGAVRPLMAEELNRVVPVIAALSADGVTVSVDTMRADVARAALGAGARVVNDVSGGLADPAILDVVAANGATYIAMHWRAHSDRMQDRATYDDEGGAVAVVTAELAARAAAVEAAGIPRDRVVLDPGLGFAKHPRHNWEILRGLDALEALGYPLLLGASRKSFLGSLLADQEGTPRAVDAREFAHVGLVTWAALRGIWGVRVHDVRACVDALAVLDELHRTPSSDPSGDPV